MSQEQAINTQQGGSDLWVAIGVVVCLGLGAGVTYWLTGTSESPVASAPPDIKGAVMGAAKPAGPQTKHPNAAAAQPTTIVNDDGEYLSVSFQTLSSYMYIIPEIDDPLAALDKRPADQIPEPIKAFNGKKVAIKGYMIPDGQATGGVKTFMLVIDQSVCCYGRTPRMNEWISVAMAGDKTTNIIKDQPVTICGTLHVGEVKERGVVLSIYRFDADFVAGPLDL